MLDKSCNVLFLCTGNSARSIMAEAALNRLGKGKFHAFSAGVSPRDEVHPFTLDLLKKQGYPTGELRPKGWEEFGSDSGMEMDFVFTVCDRTAEETCPVWPGQPMTAHWGFPDPAAFEGKEAEKRTCFADVFRMINRRLEIFVSLPFEALDRLALQKKLNELAET